MSLVFRLASRNLLHDRLRFVATVVGIVFSMVLVTVQIGLFLSFDRMVTTMIDRASADLWIMPRGTKCFEDSSMLDERERFRALSINGVAAATPLLVGFAQWRLPSGGTTPVIIIGSDMRAPGLQPWNLVAGSLEALAVPDAVAVDQTYFDRLGTSGLGDSAEIRDQKAQVAAVTKGIRSFATSPYVFAPIERARVYMGTAPNKASYFLVRLAPNAHLASVRSRLRLILADAEVLTSAEFRRRHRRHHHCGADALCQHQGSSQRVRDLAGDRIVRQVHPQGHHLAGADQRGGRILHRRRNRLPRGQDDGRERIARACAADLSHAT